MKGVSWTDILVNAAAATILTLPLVLFSAPAWAIMMLFAILFQVFALGDKVVAHAKAVSDLALALKKLLALGEKP